MKIEKFDSQEQLLVFLMDKIAERLSTHAVLKGGMALRLSDSPRSTNDLDYVFIPFKSKKDILDDLLACLDEFSGIEYQYQFNSKCLRISISTEDNINVQVEANVMLECMTSVITTNVLAKKYGLPPRIIQIMNFEVALANKIAAWCERRLIRDIYDIYYFTSVLEKRPDLETLAGLLKKLNMTRNIKPQKKSMAFDEVVAALKEFVKGLSMEDINEELAAYFPEGHLEGMNYKFRAGLQKLYTFLKESNPKSPNP